MKNNNLLIHIILILVIGFTLTSCNDDFLERQPTDELSEGTFWKSQEDAMLALTGVYHDVPGYYSGYRYGFWKPETYIRLDATTDNGYEKDNRITNINSGTVTPSFFVVDIFWESSYDKISRCNNFLSNIQNVQMNEDERAEMIAEVRFIRAYFYFWMSRLWGGVPLVTDVLTVNEANSVSRASYEEVVDFVMNELNAAANDLPETRPDDEHGRIVKAAALAIKGRLLMAEKQWAEAAVAYEEIINMGIYELDTRYEELFLDDGERSNEIILSIKNKEDDFPNRLPQAVYPFMFGGYHQLNVFKNLVTDYGMKDGSTIQESSLYDFKNPFENRDPRLEMSVFYPEKTIFKGRLYVAHPDSAGAPDRLPRRDWSGFALKKFADENFDGNPTNYGGDFPLVRYAEVLLSYLESKLEAGDPITQGLLDQTINEVRGRESVQVAPVTVTDPGELREILRRERRIELAFEGLRLYDLFRWRTAHIELDDKFYGMQITYEPETYDGQFEIDDEGFVFSKEKNFRENVDYLWPIPQDEMDINKNLEQNPGY